MRRATIASPETLEAHGADENNDSSGISIRGWSFRFELDKNMDW